MIVASVNKLIFAFCASAERSEAAIETALSPSLRADIAAAGGRRVQVNVVDAAFADAISFHTLPEPIVGTVAVWYDVERAPLVRAVVDALTAASVGHHGWTVEEREPLVGPEVPDGVRVGAMANLAFLRKPADLPYDEWRSRWQDDHTQIAIDTQATFGYVQNRVLEAVTPDAPQIVAIVEELFPEAAANDWHAFYGSGGDSDELRRRIMLMNESCERFGANRDLELISTARRRWNLA